MKVKAVIHSLEEIDEASIISHNGDNSYIAEYKGKRCTAIYNPFVGMFYVDDLNEVLDVEENS